MKFRLLAMAMLSLLLAIPGIAADSEVGISVGFVPTGHASVRVAGSRDIAKRSADGCWGMYEVEAMVHKEPGDAVVLLVALDVLVAPRDSNIDPASPDVSWGYLATIEHLHASLFDHGTSVNAFPALELNLDEVLRESFLDQGDNLWPWGFRARALLLNREATIVATAEAELWLEP